MICETHRWTKKTLPCPYLRCRHGARGLWVVSGKKKRVVYVRRRIKDEWGLRYDWEKTDLHPGELLGMNPENEEEDLVF